MRELDSPLNNMTILEESSKGRVDRNYLGIFERSNIRSSILSAQCLFTSHFTPQHTLPKPYITSFKRPIDFWWYVPILVEIDLKSKLMEFGITYI